MEHGPAVEYQEETALSDYKTKIGLRFFAIYGAAFVGFVLINTFAPQLMKVKVLLGLNLAVSYGFGLILLAIIMGLAYNAVCTKKEHEYEILAKQAEATSSKGAGK
ncbi:MAG TPA: hypothetical protein DHV69_05775 [Sphaerochaeta sp.]|jgi:uncharacterized membrane protein (DUF485 family)|nr:MAG: hypothetical protein A2Y31_09105 [Spirochaetes bacterium GWC2_52_13]OHD62642.1 MAG: hypothetical protein A2101_02975 [Spirochaetes bacterium GWF2_52_7]PKL10897.1 MAG: hypothetical protein CVV52_16090 [Spirochaetae bacterium HGW-Spirochaetae-8]PKL21987.1 MAG: hypothetical protein CVV48_05210 [Spirochaetae bacterium HGW-Spirochaetae-4]HCG62726.1 hypothetical protein [Sphaerochaeta sp.]